MACLIEILEKFHQEFDSPDFFVPFVLLSCIKLLCFFTLHSNIESCSLLFLFLKPIGFKSLNGLCSCSVVFSIHRFSRIVGFMLEKIVYVCYAHQLTTNHIFASY